MNLNNKTFCAEVVGSNLGQVTIAAWRHDQPFAYGSLVAIEQTLHPSIQRSFHDSRLGELRRTQSIRSNELLPAVAQSYGGHGRTNGDNKINPFVVSDLASAKSYRTIYAVISGTMIGSDDPSRKPFAYKLSKEELVYQQPQIFSVLQTTMTGIVVGYEQDSTICHMVAPEPAEIHSFVRPATSQEVQRFVTKPTYVQLLFSANSALNNVDELLLALVRYLKSQDALSGKSLQDMVGTYSLLTGNDYRRLKLLLSRMQQVI